MGGHGVVANAACSKWGAGGGRGGNHGRVDEPPRHAQPSPRPVREIRSFLGLGGLCTYEWGPQRVETRVGVRPEALLVACVTRGHKALAHPRGSKKREKKKVRVHLRSWASGNRLWYLPRSDGVHGVTDHFSGLPVITPRGALYGGGGAAAPSRGRTLAPWSANGGPCHGARGSFPRGGEPRSCREQDRPVFHHDPRVPIEREGEGPSCPEPRDPWLSGGPGLGPQAGATAPPGHSCLSFRSARGACEAGAANGGRGGVKGEMDEDQGPPLS